jgi:hypothetical protein
MLSTSKNAYRKRWFVLHDYILSWYKSSNEVEAGFPPQGQVDLRSAYEVTIVISFIFPIMYFITFASILLNLTVRFPCVVALNYLTRIN